MSTPPPPHRATNRPPRLATTGGTREVSPRLGRVLFVRHRERGRVDGNNAGPLRRSLEVGHLSGQPSAHFQKVSRPSSADIKTKKNRVLRRYQLWACGAEATCRIYPAWCARRVFRSAVGPYRRSGPYIIRCDRFVISSVGYEMAGSDKLALRPGLPATYGL